jgi:hypothetical protein
MNNAVMIGKNKMLMSSLRYAGRSRLRIFIWFVCRCALFLAFASRKDEVLTVHRTPAFNTPVTVSESASSPNN